MKAYAIAFLGSLGLAMMGCNIDVDDCGDDDWDDDDDEQPCETHVHSDTTSTVGGSGGTGGTADATGGGPSDSGGSSGSGGNASGGNASGGNASGGNASGGNASGGNASGGNASGGSGSGGNASGGDGSGGSASGGAASGNGSSSDTSGGAGACDDCNPLPDGEMCLWGVQKMDSCCSADVLVDVAAQECGNYGLELADFVLQDACTGGHSQVDFQCCKIGMTGCTTDEVSLDSCVGESVLSVLAGQMCADMGQELSSFETSEACGSDTYQGVQVTCCVMDPE